MAKIRFFTPPYSFLRNTRIFKNTRSIVFGALFLIAQAPSVIIAEGGPPKIEISNNTFEFGSIAEGQKVIHDFEVKNTGGSDLIIQQVVPACGCTAAVAKESTVVPGASTVVHLEFDTSGFSGEKSKAARVNSNDPVNPSVFVTVHGVIETDITFNPARVQLGEYVNATDVALPEVRVVVQTKGDSNIVSVTAGSTGLEILPISQNPQEHVFGVRPVAGAQLGDVRDRIVVVITKGGQNREVSLPVLGKAVGPISLKPSSVAMGIIEGSSIIERRIQFENRRKKPISITAIRTDNPAVTVSQRVVQVGKAVVLVVSVNPKELRSDLRSTVTLDFDDSSVAPLEFSVYGVRPEAVE